MSKANLCAACGCDFVFHQIGTGNGVPVGQPFCDDRYADPCHCRGGFVQRVQSITDERDTEVARWRAVWGVA